jgi:hypothetical protein
MTLKSILGPLKKSIFMPFKKWILALPIVAKVVIILVVIILIPFIIVVIKRMIDKRRNVNPQLSASNIKDSKKPTPTNHRINNTDNENSGGFYFREAKKIISKEGLKNHDCDLHILRNATKYSDAPHLCKSLKLLELSSDTALIVEAHKLSLLIPETSLDNLEIILTKLKLSIVNINLHYDLSKISIIDNSHVFELISNLKGENIIANIYTSDNNNIISSFNQILGKENYFKLTSDSNGEKISDFILSRIIKCSESNSTKYSCVFILNKINSLLHDLYEEAASLNMDAYLFCVLNRDANLPNSVNNTIKNSKNYFTPGSILINVLSIGFSIIFLINIITELSYIKNLNIKTNISNKKYSLNERLEYLKYKVDDSLILSSIYPEFIKFRHIYREYTKTIAEEILINFIDSSNSVSELTVLLLYVIYIKDHIVNSNTHKLSSLVHDITDISKDDLLLIVKYANNKTISQLIIKSTKAAEKFNDYKVTNISSEKALITYENKYLGISSKNRVNRIYKTLEAKLSQCTIQNLLFSFKMNRSVPLEFRYIFRIYERQFNVKETICDAGSTNIISSDMLMINKFVGENPVVDFKSLYENISIIVKNIEASGKKMKKDNPQSYEEFHKFIPILLEYAVNLIARPSDQNKFLPLVDNLENTPPINFKPNFYKKAAYISPAYSKEYVQFEIIPLIENLKKLNDQLIKYNINTDYIMSFYNESFRIFVDSYIKNYTHLVKQLNDQGIESRLISTNDSLNFYLVSMSEENYLFNIFIDYYKINTSLNNKNFEHVNYFFQKNDDFLNSDKYKEYKNIFLELKNLIEIDGYSNTYNKIKQGFEPLKEMYSSLAKISSIKDNSLYLLLKHHLDIAVKSIENIAIKTALTSLDKEVETDYFYLNSFLPFNYNSTKFMSNKKLISYIGNSGSIYSPFERYLKPLLKYNKVENHWYNDNLKLPKQVKRLKQFNKIYKLHHLLLNKDGTPKPLNIEITPIPSNDNNYMFSSFYINNKTFVNSLNVSYMETVHINYKWFAKDTISIIIKLDNGEIIQKDYSGYWSLFKAMRGAECLKGVCTWILNHKGTDYPVSFEIRSKLISLLQST